PGTTRGILAAWCWGRLSILLGLRCKVFVVCLQYLKAVCMGSRVRGRVPVEKHRGPYKPWSCDVLEAWMGDDVGQISRTAAAAPAACSVLDGTHLRSVVRLTLTYFIHRGPTA